MKNSMKVLQRDPDIINTNSEETERAMRAAGPPKRGPGPGPGGPGGPGGPPNRGPGGPGGPNPGMNPNMRPNTGGPGGPGGPNPGMNRGPPPNNMNRNPMPPNA